MKWKNAQISNMLDGQRHIMVVISNMHCSLVAPAIPSQSRSSPSPLSLYSKAGSLDQGALHFDIAILQYQTRKIKRHSSLFWNHRQSHYYNIVWISRSFFFPRWQSMREWIKNIFILKHFYQYKWKTNLSMTCPVLPVCSWKAKQHWKTETSEPAIGEFPHTRAKSCTY